MQSEIVPSLKHVIMVDNSAGRFSTNSVRFADAYSDVLADGECMRALTDQGLHPDEIVNIQFTSGTTSHPKAACLTHRSILNNGKSIGDRMLLTADDIVCCPPPLFQSVYLSWFLDMLLIFIQLFWLHSWIYGHSYTRYKTI